MPKEIVLYTPIFKGRTLGIHLCLKGSKSIYLKGSVFGAYMYLLGDF